MIKRYYIIPHHYLVMFRFNPYDTQQIWNMMAQDMGFDVTTVEMFRVPGCFKAHPKEHTYAIIGTA